MLCEHVGVTIVNLLPCHHPDEAPQHAWLKMAGLVIGAYFARKAWKKLRKSR